MEEIKVEEIKAAMASSRTYMIDNKIHLGDGFLYITETPYENGVQSDFPKKVDVTDKVLDMLLEILEKRKGQ